MKANKLLELQQRSKLRHGFLKFQVAMQEQVKKEPPSYKAKIDYEKLSAYFNKRYK